MTTTQKQSDTPIKFDKNLYHDHINKLIDSISPQFIATIKSYANFNVLFAALGVIEIFLLLLFFSLWSHSSLLAFTVAALFLTLFSYFILRMYFLSKLPEQFNEIKQRYLRAVQNLINYQEGTPEHHLGLANAAYLFAASLEGKERHIYEPPQFLKSFSVHFEKFSTQCHWHDLHKMREMLLQASVSEHIKLVKCEPTNLEVHAALANAYVMLSGLYVDPRKFDGEDDDRWLPPERYSELLKQKFRITSQRAVEELKILNDYAPHDPWVHAQLAYSYRDLQMPEEEIKEYEAIMRLRPDDKETLFKLGVLYFQQGMNGKGLRIYEELLKSNFRKAEALIKYYGAYSQTS